MKVLIITGGNSSERKISLISGKAVLKALKENGQQVKMFDLKEGYEKLEEIVNDFDVVFPVLHGEEGEGGMLQKFLSEHNVPFVGGDWRGFKEGWYKASFKRFCKKEQILTAEWKIVNNEEDIIKFGFPCVFKTSDGGSSREVIIFNSKSDIKKAKKILGNKVGAYVEQFLPGTEITVGVLGDKALPVIEIVPPSGSWFNYKNKYSGETQELVNAPSVSDELKEKAQKLALKIHQSLNLGHYSRTDFIIVGEEIYALEVNTIPGLTSESLLPKAAKAAGFDFNQFTERLVSMALEK